MIDKNLYDKAMNIAKTFDVSSGSDCVVLYSISFLPTKENKDEAFAYIKGNPSSVMIDQTSCGKALNDLFGDGADFDEQDKIKIAEVWAVASKRFIAQASGNITAFVKNADPRSVFRRIELPAIIKNAEIKTINGVDKNQFTFSDESVCF